MDLMALEPTAASTGIAYRRAGEGPPVLLLHGIPGSAATWAAVAPLLVGDHDVIVPDLLGFGASARPRSIDDLHAAGQSAALSGLLEELGLDRVGVVGHDFGGPTAVALAARSPERVVALGLMATNVFTDTPIPFPLSTVTWPVVGSVTRRVLFSRPALTMLLRQGRGPGAPDIDSAPLVGDGAQSQAIATIFAESLIHLADLYRPIEDELPRIEVPRFVAWGDHDPLFPVEQGRRVAEALRVELALLAGAGHFLPQERPAEVAGLVRDLVASAFSS